MRFFPSTPRNIRSCQTHCASGPPTLLPLDLQRVLISSPRVFLQRGTTGFTLARTLVEQLSPFNELILKGQFYG